MNDQFFVFDDALNDNDHHKLAKFMKGVLWSNQWSSTQDRPDGQFPEAWHFNIAFFNAQQGMPSATEEDIESLRKKGPALLPLWNRVSELTREYLESKYDILRYYANCNPFGVNAYIHVDDGDYTAVYYPATEWNPEWEGGTCFYEKDEEGRYDAIKYVSYKPNRLIIFPAKIPHRGMPVDKRCLVPRTVLAMKLKLDVNHSSYMEKMNAK
jgi:hypothetical protein